MSKPVSDSLPAEVQEVFNGHDLDRKIGPAYVLVTVDADGMPRPCMLSAGEILVVDPRTYRLALWPGTHTAANLARGGAVVLSFVAPGTVLHIKGSARPLGTPDGLGDTGVERFEVTVDVVESDAHPGLPVDQATSFRLEGLGRPQLLSMWTGQITALQSD